MSHNGMHNCTHGAKTLDESAYWCNISGDGVQITGSFVNASTRFVDALTRLTGGLTALTAARTEHASVALERAQLDAETARDERERSDRLQSLLMGFMGGGRRPADGGGMRRNGDAEDAFGVHYMRR